MEALVERMQRWAPRKQGWRRRLIGFDDGSRRRQAGAEVDAFGKRQPSPHGAFVGKPAAAGSGRACPSTTSSVVRKGQGETTNSNGCWGRSATLMANEFPSRPGASKSRGAFSSPQSARDKVSEKARRAVSLSSSTAFNPSARDHAVSIGAGCSNNSAPQPRLPRPCGGDPYSDGK